MAASTAKTEFAAAHTALLIWHFMHQLSFLSSLYATRAKLPENRSATVFCNCVRNTCRGSPELCVHLFNCPDHRHRHDNIGHSCQQSCLGNWQGCSFDTSRNIGAQYHYDLSDSPDSLPVSFAHNARRGRSIRCRLRGATRKLVAVAGAVGEWRRASRKSTHPLERNQ
jgi:hypothetical protein